MLVRGKDNKFTNKYMKHLNCVISAIRKQNHFSTKEPVLPDRYSRHLPETYACASYTVLLYTLFFTQENPLCPITCFFSLIIHPIGWSMFRLGSPENNSLMECLCNPRTWHSAWHLSDPQQMFDELNT